MSEWSSAASALQAGARCAVHAEKAATGVCGRCGDYLCGLCGRQVGEGLNCVRCAERVGREHSPRAIRAFVFGLCAVHGLFPLAPVALVLALAELSAIAAGEAPVGGSGFARAGLALGAAGLAMPIGGALVWWLTQGS
jgi:hypothetical protein